jgi:hypothetical protein
MLAAKLNDAAFGATSQIVISNNQYIPVSQCPFANPGVQIDNPNPDKLRVGDIIKFIIDENNNYRVGIIIGKNSTQLLIVTTDMQQKIDWEAFILKTAKIEYALSRYQTVAPDPTATPSATPSASPSATPTGTPGNTFVAVSDEEKTATQTMLDFPRDHQDLAHGRDWTVYNGYTWSALTGSPLNIVGSEAFAAIVSDRVFGQGAKNLARKVVNPNYYSIRIGDIIRFDGDRRSAIIIDRDSDYLTLAEGDYNGKISWGRKIPKSTKIDYILTRWPA